jgi:DNA-binding NarL/FixJ family response regulator
MDVLALVAEGLTNVAIAERLVLSPRTVESHVASALRKTGAAGRAHLRAVLKPTDLPGRNLGVDSRLTP